jgi:UDP-N-acetylmuramoyl-tripeptide--D-alanyl-D-alanine ligase
VKLAVALAASAAFALAAIRWLRVAQREHYIPMSATAFFWRWWTCRPANALLLVAAMGGAVACWFWPGAGLVTAAAVAVGPLGLSLRGRTSHLRWTPRLQRLAAVTGVIYFGGAVSLLSHLPVAWVVVVTLFPSGVVDGASFLTGPLERRLSEGFVRTARKRLRDVAPTVVAITGSYGKTTTKEYVRHLVAGSKTVVATPASFNNRLGLARAINDHLTPGTDVFVAEMGTYAPGEIAEMTSWVRPDISVITAVGPVHLERFRTLERIAKAKAEIVDGAPAVVINGDEPLILEAVEKVAGEARILRCSVTDPGADVFAPMGEGSVAIHSGREVLGLVDADVFPMNVACAVAVALELGIPQEAVARRLPDLPTPEHRRQAVTSPRGVLVIDDTYNSNPEGAAAALELLARVARDGARRVVVTPGMVELGRRQNRENRTFAERAATLATDVLVVGRTNRRPLLAGSSGGRASVTVMEHRDQAVAWVRNHLGPGDVVLYENDLPDHYP